MSDLVEALESARETLTSDLLEELESVFKTLKSDCANF